MTVGFGIDFGTSNSALALARSDGSVQVAKWRVPQELVGHIESSGETGAPYTSTLPTVLFAPSYETGIYAGYEAIARYLFTGLEGRFIQSIKAFLPQATFTGTTIRGRHFAIEELIACFLRALLAGAKTALSQPLEGRIVLGRPARFSLDPQADRLAEQRLVKAAALAGLTEVVLVIEPIAAALAYEATLQADELVLVVDLGGGTSDFTLMHVGPSHTLDRNDSSRVVASGGLPLAGDAIDGEIVEARLFDAFGFGARYQAFDGPASVPDWMFHRLKRWNHVSFLKSKETLDFLHTAHASCDRRAEIGRLIELVEEDMGYLLFRAVERAKRRVQTDKSARIADLASALPVDRELTPKQFGAATAPLVEQIRQTALAVLTDGGVAPKAVDAVFLTGGTSLNVNLRTAFGGLFGGDKLRTRSTFTSVVDGLARAALSTTFGRDPPGV